MSSFEEVGSIGSLTFYHEMEILDHVDVHHVEVGEYDGIASIHNSENFDGTILIKGIDGREQIVEWRCVNEYDGL